MTVRLKCPLCGKEVSELGGMKQHLFSQKHGDGAELLKILEEWVADNDYEYRVAQKELQS